MIQLARNNLNSNTRNRLEALRQGLEILFAAIPL